MNQSAETTREPRNPTDLATGTCQAVDRPPPARVESARARVRVRGGVPESRLADARRELDALWTRCELWELSPAVCDLASHLAPDQPLRPLDALHLATFLLARGRIEGLELVTVDKRLEDAAHSA